MTRRRIAILFLCMGFAVCVALSFVHPWGDLRAGARGDALLVGANVPADVRQVVEGKCADCHSNNTHWPFYSRVAPGSWVMERDVREGREHLNFSSWSQYSADSQIDLLVEIARESRKGEMPVRQYLWLHPSARLTEEEKKALAIWVRDEVKRLRRETSGQ